MRGILRGSVFGGFEGGAMDWKWLECAGDEARHIRTTLGERFPSSIV